MSFMDDFTDISSEASRAYIYADASAYVINSPQLLLVKKSSDGGHSHRVVSEHEGVRKSHYIRPGWIAIEWVKRDASQPDFIF
jgi:hypothetical protein